MSERSADLEMLAHLKNICKGPDFGKLAKLPDGTYAVRKPLLGKEMGGTMVSDGAVKTNGGEATLGGEVERGVPTICPDSDKLCY